MPGLDLIDLSVLKINYSFIIQKKKDYPRYCPLSMTVRPCDESPLTGSSQERLLKYLLAALVLFGE